MRHKKPAEQQVGIDLDIKVVERWRSDESELCDIVHDDAVNYLRTTALDADTLIYVDPPYHPETRRRTRVYRCDYGASDHERLLACLVNLPCKVMISGYFSRLYESVLSGWSIYKFDARTHVDTREECVWYNYPMPTLLHDDRYFGANFRERELIRRRQSRLRRRIEELSLIEKASLHTWLGQNLLTAS